jgi:rhodanese-related sulfurtransferase
MNIPEISPEALAGLLRGPPGSRPVLVDVRTPEEHALVALPDSLLLPLSELGSRSAEIEALQGKEVVVYCHHGVRSLRGAAFLASKGIQATSLAGGIDAYALGVDKSLKRY